MVPPRTTALLVQGILGNDWDGANWSPGSDAPPPTDLTPYIATASNLVDKAILIAQRRDPGGVTIANDPVTAELVERWLSAYYYTKMDPIYKNKSTQGASAGFVRDSKNRNDYLVSAIELDNTGAVNALINRLHAGFAHLGSAFCGGR